MANIDIQIKMKNENGVDWDDLFPKTKGLLVNMGNGKTLEDYLSEIVSSIAGKATTSDIDSRIQALIGSAPSALDTLKEIASALNNDANFAATITNQLSGKVNVTDFNTFKNSITSVTSQEKAIWSGKSKVVLSTTAPTDADVWYQEV